MKSAKQERPSEQRFPITFQSVSAQTPHEAAKPCFAFRGLHYHVDARFEDRFFQGAARQLLHHPRKAKAGVVSKHLRFTTVPKLPSSRGYDVTSRRDR